MFKLDDLICPVIRGGGRCYCCRHARDAQARLTRAQLEALVLRLSHSRAMAGAIAQRMTDLVKQRMVYG